jgi:hypothetical protein
MASAVQKVKVSYITFIESGKSVERSIKKVQQIKHETTEFHKHNSTKNM